MSTTAAKISEYVEYPTPPQCMHCASLPVVYIVKNGFEVACCRKHYNKAEELMADGWIRSRY